MFFRDALSFLGAMVLGMTVGTLLLAYAMAGEIYEYQDTVKGDLLPPVDAIVCLAGGRGRITEAGDLWLRYRQAPFETPSGRSAQAPILYISGMGHDTTWKAFLNQVHPEVSSVIRQSQVVMEDESANTESNGKWLARYLKQKKFTRILLVTSTYHMRRAQYMVSRVLKEAGIPVRLETLSVHQDPYGPGEWRQEWNGVRVTMTEYLKWVYYKNLWRP